jgi:hypothetical protein
MTETATRTTKSETITRSIAVSQAKNGTCAASISEVHHRKGEPKIESDTYFLRLIRNQLGGIAVEVEKLGKSELHHVRLNTSGVVHTCDCKWGTYKGHAKPCRHVEMCLQAIQEGKLTAPKFDDKPQAPKQPETKPEVHQPRQPESEPNYETCGFCSGTGFTYRGMYDCDGRKVYDEPPRVTCEYCGGSGMIADGHLLMPAFPREYYLRDED